MSQINHRTPSPKGFVIRDSPTSYAPPPFSRETEAYSRRGQARIETAQIDYQMLRGATEYRTSWQTQLTQQLAQESTTVMRVAPAEMAVHTRVYHVLTGTLPGIPVGIARTRRREKNRCTQQGKAVKSVTHHARARHSVSNGTKQQHHSQATKVFKH